MKKRLLPVIMLYFATACQTPSFAQKWSLAWLENFQSLGENFLDEKNNWSNQLGQLNYKRVPLESGVGMFEIPEACANLDLREKSSACWPIVFTKNVPTRDFQAIGMELIIQTADSINSSNHVMVMMGVSPVTIANGQTFTRIGAGLVGLDGNKVRGVFQLTGVDADDPGAELVTRFVTFPLAVAIHADGNTRYAITFEKYMFMYHVLGIVAYRATVYLVIDGNYQHLGEHVELFNNSFFHGDDGRTGIIPETKGAECLMGLVFDGTVKLRTSAFYLAIPAHIRQ